MAIILSTQSSSFQDTNSNGFAEIGEQILYTFQIQNTGTEALTGITFSNPDIVISPGFDGTLGPGATKTVTGLYAIKAADLDNGRVVISQTASAGSLTSNTTPPDTEPLTVRAALSVTKEAREIENTNGNNIRGDAGDKIIYDITVRNTSPRTAYNVTLRDFPGGGGTGIPLTLSGLTDAPGDTDLGVANDLAIGGVATGIFEYTILQDDVDNAAQGIAIVNRADARGVTKTNTPISGSSSTTVDLGPQPDFTIIKTAGNVRDAADAGEFIDLNGNGVVDTNDKIKYTYLFTNTGNVTLENVVGFDDRGVPGGSEEPLVFTPGSLAPGQSATATYDAPVTQAFLDSGTLTNTVRATATPIGGIRLEFKNDQETVTVTNTPNINVTKLANPVLINNARVGDLVQYSYTLNNPGPVSLLNVNLVDDNGTPGVTTDDVTINAIGTFRNGVQISATGLTTGLTDIDNDGQVDDLAVGATTTATYTGALTQPAIDKGFVTNIVVGTGTDRRGRTVTDEDRATVTIDAPPKINVTKVANPTSITNPTVGAPIQYSYTLTNPGPVSLLNVNLVDDNGTPGVTTDDVTINAIGTFRNGIQIVGAPGLTTGLTDIDGDGQVDDLAVGATTTATYTGNLTQAIIDQGFVTNIVVGKGTDSKGNTVTDNATANVIVQGQSQIDVTKAANPTSIANAKVGDPIEYSYTLKNPGPVTLFNVNLVDDNGTPGVTSDDVTINAIGTFRNGIQITGAPGLTGGLTDLDGDGQIDDLAVGATTNATYTGTVTQKALEDGFLNNVVVGRGIDPRGNTVTDNAPASVTLNAPPKINVTKAANPIIIPNPTVGAPIQYTYTLTNPGPVNLLNVNLVDDNGTPGVTTDDVTINAIGTFRNGVQIVGAPGLTGGLTDIDGDGQIDDLAVGATTNATYTGALTQATIDEGSVINIVTGKGTDSKGNTVTDNATAKVTLGNTPRIDVTKVANPVSINNAKVGDLINYTYTLTNPGPVTLFNVNLVDDNGTPGLLTDDVTINATGTFRNGIQIVGAPGLTGGLADLDGDSVADDLAVGATTNATYTGTVTQKALEDGFLNNVVVGRGVDSRGNPVTDDAPASVTLNALPRINVTKAANPIVISNPTVGAPIQYTYTLTNPGPVNLLNVNLVDDNGTPGLLTDDVTINAIGTFRNGVQIVGAPGLTSGLTDIDGDGQIDDLAVGATTNATYTGALTQAAINEGSVINIVVGKGTDSKGNTVTDNATAKVDVTKPATPPKLKLVKTAGAIQNHDCDPNPSPGDTVTYTYEITNLGEVPVYNLILKDDNGTPNLTTDDFEIAIQGLETLDRVGTLNDLGVGKKAVGYYTKTLTAEDICNCYFTNVGTVTGSGANGQTVTAQDDETIVFCPPHIQLEKCAELDLGSDHKLNVGDVVKYSFHVSNTGSIALNNIVIDDPMLRQKNVTITFANGVTSLAAGECVDAVATYRITQADIDAGSLHNVATVYGNPIYGKPNDRSDDVKSSAEASICLPQCAEISIDKVTVYGNQKGEYLHIPAGSAISWEYTITNKGNVSLRDIALNDQLTGAVAKRNITSRSLNNDDVLDVGETWVYKVTGTAIAGDYCSDGTVTGYYTDCDGNRQSASATDWNDYIGYKPKNNAGCAKRSSDIPAVFNDRTVHFGGNNQKDYSGPLC